MKFLLVLIILILSGNAFAFDFRLVTWNIFMLPKPIKFSDQYVRTNHLGEEFKRIQNDVDFVVLNEAFSSEVRDLIAKKMKSTHPFTAMLEKHGGITKVMDSGVMVLSRFPFTILGKSYYRDCASADCFASKGVLLVEVQLPEGRKIQVAATHMQSGNSQDEIRKTQFEQIKQLLILNHEFGVPQILVGDLNSDSDKKERFEAVLTHLDMTTIEATGLMKTSKASKTKCFLGADRDPKGWIDHVLIGNNGSQDRIKLKEVHEVKSTYKCDLSDHLPVKG